MTRTWALLVMACHLFAVATDDSRLEALARALERRYGPDYSIAVANQPEEGLRRLRSLRETGDQVALVIAQFRMGDSAGVSFLIAAHEIFPGARRVLMIDVGDVTASHDLSQALTLNQIDSYFGQPWASPEEELYPVVNEALRLWALEHEPRYDKAFIVDAPGGLRGPTIRSWLERNTVTTQLLTSTQSDGRALLARHGVTADELPVVVLYNGTVLVNPELDQLSQQLGGRVDPSSDRYDIAVVGAGPAGLAAAVYACAEGLQTIVVEHDCVGGQAGISFNIRNYLGFPWGVNGGELIERAWRQAEQLGAEVIVPRQVTGIRSQGEERIITLSSGAEVEASAVVVAAGVTYRRLGVPAVDALIGAGVFYGAAVSEARSMGGLDVFVLGGGNSAGQAAAHLASSGANVTMLIRGASLEASMSDYLVRELEGAENITVRTHTEVIGAGGSERLEHLDLRDGANGQRTTVAADVLCIFIGAHPNTDWMGAALALDEHGFILTGSDLHGVAVSTWPLDRPPAWLETSLPRVFAAGDIRHGSVKRVAAAVGEGSSAAMLVRERLRGGPTG